MVVCIEFIEIIVRVIEWVDSSRDQPIAFLLNCPKCSCQNWARTADLYQAYDKTVNNLKCKMCGAGKLRAEELKKRKPDLNLFKPKQVGWQSIFKGQC